MSYKLKIILIFIAHLKFYAIRMETTITNDIVIENENTVTIRKTSNSDSKEFLIGVLYIFKKLFMLS